MLLSRIKGNRAGCRQVMSRNVRPGQKRRKVGVGASTAGLDNACDRRDHIAIGAQQGVNRTRDQLLQNEDTVGTVFPVVATAKQSQLCTISSQGRLKMTEASLAAGKIVHHGNIAGVEGRRFAIEPNDFPLISLAAAGESVGEPDITPGAVRG